VLESGLSSVLEEFCSFSGIGLRESQSAGFGYALAIVPALLTTLVAKSHGFENVWSASALERCWTLAVAFVLPTLDAGFTGLSSQSATALIYRVALLIALGLYFPGGGLFPTMCL